MAQPPLTFVANTPSFSRLALNSGLVAARGSAGASGVIRAPCRPCVGVPLHSMVRPQYADGVLREALVDHLPHVGPLALGAADPRPQGDVVADARDVQPAVGVEPRRH